MKRDGREDTITLESGGESVTTTLAKFRAATERLRGGEVVS